MNELITVIEKDNQQLVSARELHAALEIKKDFSDWFKCQIESLELTDGEDFTTLEGKSTGGRPRTDYILTIECAKDVAVASRTSKGRELRRYLIRFEEEHRNKTTITLEPVALLKLAVSELEKKDVLIQEKEKQISVMKPKADFVDNTFKVTKDLISFGDFAKTCNIPKDKGFIGRNQFIQICKDIKVIDSNRIPYQMYINLNYFVVKQSEKNGFVFRTSFITPKGQVWLRTKVLAYLNAEKVENA